jgi:hypothetical protein
MEYSNTLHVTDDHAVVERIYDLARNGETASNEFIQLDHLVFDALQQAYGGEIQRLRALVA